MYHEKRMRLPFANDLSISDPQCKIIFWKPSVIGRLQYQMDRTEQRYVMKFLFMDGRKYKVIHTELSRVLKGQAASVDIWKD
jgi:hypothetical protein